MCIYIYICECGPNIARYIYIYSGLTSNVDVLIVVLIVFGGSSSKGTCLFAKMGSHQKHMLPMVNITSSHTISLKYTSTT